MAIAAEMIVITINTRAFPQANIKDYYVKWMEPIFVLIDSLVLIVAIIKINKALKDYPNFSSNERFMVFHVLMTFLLAIGTFILILGEILTGEK